MWPREYQPRLDQWVQIRTRCKDLDFLDALSLINAWWFSSPWRPYHLHWDDFDSWPNPWDLLANDFFCDLARGVGIMYTVMMVNHKELDEVCLIESDQGNLVLVNDGKYILNWSPEQVLNIGSKPLTITRTIKSSALRHMTD